MLLSSQSNADDHSAQLLAEDCEEFGSSGYLYNKQQILAALRGRVPVELQCIDFQFRVLGPEVVLVTYRSIHRNDRGTVCCLRSSVWCHTLGQWQLAFHQGTPSHCPESAFTV